MQKCDQLYQYYCGWCPWWCPYHCKCPYHWKSYHWKSICGIKFSDQWPPTKTYKKPEELSFFIIKLFLLNTFILQVNIVIWYLYICKLTISCTFVKIVKFIAHMCFKLHKMGIKLGILSILIHLSQFVYNVNLNNFVFLNFLIFLFLYGEIRNVIF